MTYDKHYDYDSPQSNFLYLNYSPSLSIESTLNTVFTNNERFIINRVNRQIEIDTKTFHTRVNESRQ